MALTAPTGPTSALAVPTRTALQAVVDDPRRLDDAALLELLQGSAWRATAVGAVGAGAPAALAVALSTSAFAAQTHGTIESISKARDTFRLANGKTFHLPEGIEVEHLKVGEHVKVNYVVEKNKVRQVSAVTRMR